MNPEDHDDARARVGEVLAELAPLLAADGGALELVDLDLQRGRVSVRFKGACAHCPSSSYTLSFAVEARLKERLSFVREVVAI